MVPLYMLMLNYSVAIGHYLEMPMYFVPCSVLRSQILEPMQLTTLGSVEAAYLAMEKGWAINLGGGYNHATT
jgi:histone deacetylase 11